MATVILLTPDTLTKNTMLGGSIDVDRMIPAIKDYQKTRLKEILGNDLYVKIQLDFSGGTLSGLYEELYEDYVKEMVIHGACENYLAYGAYQVANTGIVKTKTEQSETVDKNELNFMIEASRKMLFHYEREFLKWIKLNPLAEYPVSCNNSKYTNVGGWWLTKKDNC